MDLQRSGSRKSRWVARAAMALLLVGLLLFANWSVSRLIPNLPTVDTRILVFDTVRSGEFVHEIRCVGQLVSTEQNERPARTAARVKRIVALPGVEVQPQTLLLELVNPDLELALLDASSKRAEAHATLVTEKARFESQLIQLKSAWSKLESDHAVAEAEYDVSKELWKKNAFSEQQLRYREITATGLLKQRELAQEAYERYDESMDDHLAIFREKISQANTNLQHAKDLIASLNVHADVAGVLAQVPVTVGQQLEAGELLAKIVNPKKLKAEMRVAEVEASYIKVGQQAKVDTRHGVILGTVSRVEPEVKEGSVTIDVTFEGDRLPAEARPDLSVTGLIEVNRLTNVLSVGRPASALANGTGDIFRCEDLGTKDATRAIRTPVEFGIASANAIVVSDGLAEGDRVILSDLSKFNETNEIVLK